MIGLLCHSGFCPFGGALLSDGSLSHSLCHMKEWSLLSPMPHLPSLLLFLHLLGSLGKVVDSGFDRGKTNTILIRKKRVGQWNCLNILTVGNFLAIFFSPETQWLGPGPFFIYFLLPFKCPHIFSFYSLHSLPTNPSRTFLKTSNLSLFCKICSFSIKL